jgi:uncharacterized membrane protein
VDLLVVLQPGRRGVTSLRIRRAIDYRFALDLIVLTAGKFCERLKESDFFLLDIVEQGIVLYEEDNG